MCWHIRCNTCILIIYPCLCRLICCYAETALAVYASCQRGCCWYSEACLLDICITCCSSCTWCVVRGSCYPEACWRNICLILLCSVVCSCRTNTESGCSCLSCGCTGISFGVISGCRNSKSSEDGAFLPDSFPIQRRRVGAKPVLQKWG